MGRLTWGAIVVRSIRTQSAAVTESLTMEAHNLFGLGSLSDLGLRRGVDMRPTLLRVLTDLFMHRLSHTADEERHYTELALRLLEVVDVPTRVAVATRFARYASPPLRVLQSLARDLPEVAAELRSHPLLQPSVPVVNAPPQSTAMPMVEENAVRKETRLAHALPTIDSMTAGELNERFFAANADERRLILLNLHIVAPVAPDHIRVSRDPSVGQRLETAALARNLEEFTQHLARSLQIPREQAQRMARDDLGEPVAVAGKALGLRRDVLYRILMFVNPAVGHSVERVHALAVLYDEMTHPAAEGMVAIWQALQRNEHAGVKHRPLAWDDATHRRARPAAIQRTPAAPPTSERRSAS